MKGVLSHLFVRLGRYRIPFYSTPVLTYGVVMMEFRGKSKGPGCPRCRHKVVEDEGGLWLCKNHPRCFCAHRCHPDPDNGD